MFIMIPWIPITVFLINLSLFIYLTLGVKRSNAILYNNLDALYRSADSLFEEYSRRIPVITREMCDLKAKIALLEQKIEELQSKPSQQ